METAGSSSKISQPRRKKNNPRQTEAQAIALIRASGILNKDAKLDEILTMAERLGIDLAATAGDDGTTLIYKGFVYTPCG